MGRRAAKPKRRPNGSPPVPFKVRSGKHTGMWRARVKAPDGTVVATVSSMDYDECVAKLERARREYEAHGYIANKTATLTAWSEQWLETIAGAKVRGKTWATYASLMRKHVQPLLGAKPLPAITPADVRSLRAAIAAKGLSSTTALQAHRILARCLEDARRENLITSVVTDRVDAPRRAAVERGSFTVDQVKRILRLAADPATGVLGSRHIAQILMGVRQSEALGLTVHDLDLDAGHARIRWQLQELQSQHGCGIRSGDTYPCGYKQGARCPAKSWRVPDGTAFRVLSGRLALVSVKSKAGERVVPLLPPVVAAIRQHLKDTPASPDGLIWHDGGQPISHRDDEGDWKKLMRAAGLPESCTTHWARHSVATLLMEAGVDVKIIGEIVGHGSVAVTRGYQHVSSAAAAEAMGKLGRVLALGD